MTQIITYVDFLKAYLPINEDGTIDFGELSAEEIASMRAEWCRKHAIYIWNRSVGVKPKRKRTNRDEFTFIIRLMDYYEGDYDENQDIVQDANANTAEEVEQALVNANKRPRKIPVPKQLRKYYKEKAEEVEHAFTIYNQSQ